MLGVKCIFNHVSIDSFLVLDINNEMQEPGERTTKYTVIKL